MVPRSPTSASDLAGTPLDEALAKVADVQKQAEAFAARETVLQARADDLDKREADMNAAHAQRQATLDADRAALHARAKRVAAAMAE